MCQAIGWSLYALAVATPYVMRGLVSLGSMAVYVIALSGLGLAQTHALRAYAKRRDWIALDGLRLAPRVLVTSSVMGALMTAYMVLAGVYWFGRPTWSEIEIAPLFFAWLWWFLPVFVGWQALYFGAHFVRRARQAELEKWQLRAEVQAAELRFLKAQLNPHFLFNALNSVRALIAEDPARAQAMVTELSIVLRHALNSAEGVIPLEKELDVVNAYLALESVRLEDRLRVMRDIDPGALSAKVPPMLVQGLVENGIKHGIALLPRGGELSISAKMRDDTLVLDVTNATAPPKARRDPSEGGVGLVNTRERLRLLFGEGASLALEETDGRTTARVLIPRAAS